MRIRYENQSLLTMSEGFCADRKKVISDFYNHMKTISDYRIQVLIEHREEIIMT